LVLFDSPTLGRIIHQKIFYPAELMAGNWESDYQPEKLGTLVKAGN
jgi:hypothetical protein